MTCEIRNKAGDSPELLGKRRHSLLNHVRSRPLVSNSWLVPARVIQGMGLARQSRWWRRCVSYPRPLRRFVLTIVFAIRILAA